MSNHKEYKMENCKCNSKQLPGWEQYQSKAEQAKQEIETLGFYDPSKFNPSEQEVSLSDRLQSKLTQDEKVEYGLEPSSPPQSVFLEMSVRRRRK
jgi:ribosomal protein S16